MDASYPIQRLATQLTGDPAGNISTVWAGLVVVIRFAWPRAWSRRGVGTNPGMTSTQNPDDQPDETPGGSTITDPDVFNDPEDADDDSELEADFPPPGT
jgi:hypothetical protein